MHKIFCIIGRTASGKSTIVSAVAKDMKLKVLKSYTTRARRKNEVGKHCDHTFISADDVNKYMDDMVAYTERSGYCSFATESQLMDSDLYIINPSGYSDLINTTRDIPNELYIKRHQIIELCNIVVDGEYIDEQKDLSLKFRGSKNQRVIDVKQSLAQNKVVLYCD